MMFPGLKTFSLLKSFHRRGAEIAEERIFSFAGLSTANQIIIISANSASLR
jgi:hypothetical protein